MRYGKTWKKLFRESSFAKELRECGRQGDNDPSRENRGGYSVREKPVLSTRYGLLYQTDCMNLFASLKDNVLDCIFADPPFNLGKDYGNGEFNDALTTRDYLKWCYAWLDECIRVLKSGGALFVYILPQWGYRFATHLEEQGMLFRHWIALSMKGTFPRGQKLYPAHYGLLYFTKGSKIISLEFVAISIQRLGIMGFSSLICQRDLNFLCLAGAVSSQKSVKLSPRGLRYFL